MDVIALWLYKKEEYYYQIKTLQVLQKMVFKSQL